MKKIHISKEEIKEYFRLRKERRERILEKRRNSKFAKKMAPVYQMMNRLSLLMHLFLALFLNLTIEVISRHSLVKAWDYMTGSPWTFLYNTYIIFITFLPVYMVRRRVFTRIIISVVWLVLGVANGYLLSVRVTPFNAQDLKVLSDAMTLADKYFSGVQGIVLAIGIVALIVWLISMWRRGGQYIGKMHRWIALAVVVAAFATSGLVTELAINKRLISNYFGNIAFAYEDYGFPYCFSSSLLNTGISQPAGYTKEYMQEISNDGKIQKSSTKRKEMPNIIFVQLESFFDPYELEFLQMSEDPIPNFRKLMKKYSSGYFKAPSVGAGTANTEFEVLTGMNMRYFGPGEYPYKTIVKYEPMESAASALSQFGYSAHALHNNGGNFYSRADVFSNMGFESYTSKEFMNILQKTENGWAKDNILTQHITNAMDSTEEQDFVFCITVQGHGDYPEEKVIENPRITVTGAKSEGKNNAWEYYVNQLYETDQFVGDLVDTLNKRNEPTVLVLYGDHLPTMGLEVDDLKSRYLYNTNYVIWDNIGLKRKNTNLAAYQIMADVFERLDLHAGTVFNYHQARRQTKNYLSDLELLQYDLLYGEQYLYQDLSESLIEEPHIQMGILEVTLSGLSMQLDGSFSLYGENFTQNSRVYVNGNQVSRTFLNNTRMEIEEGAIKDGDEIVVSQVGSSNRIFRSSAVYLWKDGQLVLKPEEPQEGAEPLAETKEDAKETTKTDEKADTKKE